MDGVFRLEFLEDTHVGGELFLKGESYNDVHIRKDKVHHTLEVRFGDGSVVNFPYIWLHTAFTIKKVPAKENGEAISV